MKIISHDEIEKIVGKQGLKIFQKWMGGQTVPDKSHVYLHDFDHWYSYYKRGRNAPEID